MRPTHRRIARSHPSWPATLAGLFCLAALLAACGSDSPDRPDDDPSNPVDPPTGQSDFLSADGRAGQETGERNDFGAEEPAAAADDSDGADERTVEEGDIYRVLDDAMILNLNAYRGLQLIDFSDVSEPAIVGRAQISGHPVEMYAVGDRVFILMNNWMGYYGINPLVADSVAAPLEQRQGGVVAVADISDRENPRILQHRFVPGYIQTSRLTRQGDRAALYVVAGGYNYWENDDGTWEWETRTYVRSFDASSGLAEERTELDLGGYVNAIQATPEALLVARTDWNDRTPGSRVAMIDISSPEGTMVEGDQIRVAGYVENKFNMDLDGDVLRIVSGNRWWGSGHDNYVQTFDASNPDDLRMIDVATFGENEDLYATLFMGEKAFFVTYRRVDPFHAFHIDAEGNIEEKSEFIVSGWNDYFRPVFSQSRLIGIGVEDTGGRTMAVSLYDVTDLENPEPMLARREVAADNSWSEASWDDRAFSVLEGAVDVLAADGTRETGLVLLPFQGWSDRHGHYTAAVQIFTFSESTLTRRGTMDHGTPVRRSFRAEGSTTANLSEMELSLFDTEDPDAPHELGRVELAPNYADFLVFGDFGARIVDSADYFYGWYRDDADLPPTRVEIVSMDEDPDAAEPVATIELPARATVLRVGELLVGVSRLYVESDDSDRGWEVETTIDAVDLSDPRRPERRGSFVTTEIPESYGGYYGWGMEDCWDCGRYYAQPIVLAVGDALVFTEYGNESELLGSEEVCGTYPTDWSECDGRMTLPDGFADPEEEEDCAYYEGGIQCRTLEGEPTLCTGEILECRDREGSWECESIDLDSIDTHTDCWDYERHRHWQTHTYHVVDLSDADAPSLADPVAMFRGDEAVSTIADGDDLLFSFRRPAPVDDDGLTYVRYFVRAIDLSDPSNPEVGRRINVPGEVLGRDGNDLFTRDFVWGDEVVETSVAKVRVNEGRAYLLGRYTFADEQVTQLVLGDDGRVLVTHQPVYRYSRGREYDEADYATRLTILDGAGSGLDELGSTIVDRWATLQGVRGDRALFQVPGGLMVYHVGNPEFPFAQAFYPTRGWPRRIELDDDRFVVPAGRYGVYAFPLDEFNLLPLTL